jgi:hypothetical protein
MRINLLRSKQANPRKAQPGTAYTATGLQAPDVSAEVGSSRAAPIQELVPELASPFTRTQTYAKMMNDAGVDVSIRVWKTPMMGAEYFVEPYSDRPEDIEIAEFIEANLMGGMSSPFINSIEDILHFCEDGYAVLQKVYENRNWAPKRTGSNGKMYTMLKKLGVRPPTTIAKITYDDNGGPVSITHNAIKGDNSTQEIEIPINKLVIFTLNRKGGDLTGKSMLRTAYPHWYYKTHAYKIDAIQKERHGIGVPRGKLLPGFTSADVEAMRTLLRNLRTNEESFMLLTPNVEVDFAELSGQPVNVMETAGHHNMMILMNVMAQFMTLGVEGQGGGRATAGAQTDIFVKSVKYVAGYIAEQFNMYCIPELVVWNFKTTNFPQVKVRNIGDTRDLQMFASAIANLFAQKAITGDEDTENWLRQVFDMPTKAAGTRPASADIPPGVTMPTEQKTTQNGGQQKGSTKQQRDKVGSNVGKPPAAPE